MSDVEFRSDYVRVTDVEACAGKVVAAIVARGHVPDAVGILFADGTYLCCEAIYGYDVASLSFDGEIDEDRAVAIGIIDAAEYRRVKEGQIARQARQAHAKMLADMRERGLDAAACERMEAEYGA